MFQVLYSIIIFFCENSRKVDKHFSLFFVKISRKLSHFLVIFHENKNIGYFVCRSTMLFLIKFLQSKLTDLLFLLVIYN